MSAPVTPKATRDPQPMTFDAAGLARLYRGWLRGDARKGELDPETLRRYSELLLHVGARLALRQRGDDDSAPVAGVLEAARELGVLDEQEGGAG